MLPLACALAFAACAAPPTARAPKADPVAPNTAGPQVGQAAPAGPGAGQVASASPGAGKVASASPGAGKAASGTAGLPTGDIHDFDFLIGDRVGQNRRLKARGVGSNEWDEFVGVSRTRQYLGGMVNVGEVNFPTKGWSGLTMRVFNPETRQWSIYWISSKRGTLDPSQVGGFTGDRGEFYGDDEDNGRRVKVRYTWTKTGPDTARWEQAFSYDGRTWETNWTSDFVRTAR
jgi:hypothetical protein